MNKDLFQVEFFSVNLKFQQFGTIEFFIILLK